MEPKRHIQMVGTNMSICGLGLPYPSSIAFVTEDKPATCTNCIKRSQK